MFRAFAFVGVVKHSQHYQGTEIEDEQSRCTEDRYYHRCRF